MSVKEIKAVKIQTSGSFTPVNIDENTAIEAPVTIEVEGYGAFTIMCTPEDKRALAVGFCQAEGIIQSVDDIALIQECLDDENVIRIKTVNHPEADSEIRNMAIMSSCGLCGSMKLSDILESLPQVKDKLRLKPNKIEEAIRNMSDLQNLFKKTGATHAAAIYDSDSRIVSMAEDIGRHNALDKAIGKLLLTGRKKHRLAVALSGRTSLEMVIKAARAGLEAITAISAPTSLAVKAADICGITLCGFIRGGKMIVYTHNYRIEFG